MLFSRAVKAISFVSEIDWKDESPTTIQCPKNRPVSFCKSNTFENHSGSSFQSIFYPANAGFFLGLINFKNSATFFETSLPLI